MKRISVTGNAFTDENGRERIFNGINYVYKGVAENGDGVIDYRTEITAPGVLTALAARGINLIRLGVTWAGIEPEPGKYNTVYLDGVKDVLGKIEKAGIYAYIDWHQDLYSHYLRLPGDGAPAWACSRTDGVSKKTPFTWAEGYFLGRDVQKSFDAFWNNKPYEGRGLIDRFCDMLSFTVAYLGDSPAIIGYDVLNEPFPGTPGGRVFRRLVASGIKTLAFDSRVDRKKLISDFLGGRVMEMLSVADDSRVYHSVIDAGNEEIKRFDTEKYMPFLTKAGEAVRRAGGKGVIFAENCYYSNLGIPCSVERPVYPGLGEETAFAFAPHGYDITVDSPLTNEASPYRVDHIFNEHERTQARLCCPALVGEWGGMVPGSEEYPALRHLIEKFDRNRWSHTYWHYHEGFESGKIIDTISRPYPVAVAGRIKKYGYDFSRREFVLSYSGSSSVKAPTLIYLPSEPKKIFSTKGAQITEKDGVRYLSVYAGKGECVVKAEF